MTVKKIRMRPEGSGDYADYLYPETSADIIIETSTKKVMTSDERTKLAGLPSSALPTSGGDLTGTLKVMEVKEHCSVLVTAFGATPDLSLLDGTLYYNRAEATNDVSFALRGDGTTSLNSMLATGESITFAVLLTNGSTAYKISGVTITGATVGLFWANGSAPSGNASGVDIYLFNVIKTGDNVFSVFASQSKFATVA